MLYVLLALILKKYLASIYYLFHSLTAIIIFSFIRSRPIKGLQLYSHSLEREIEGERGEEGSELVQQQRLTNYLWNCCIHSHLKRNLSEAACSTAYNTAPRSLSPLSLPLTYDGLSLMQIYNHFICRCLPCPSRNIPQHHASRCPPRNTLHHRPPLNLAFHKSQQNKDKCSDFGCLNIVPQRNTFNMMLWARVNALRRTYTPVVLSETL